MIVHALIDKFMTMVMQRLGFKIPKFILTRYCTFSLEGKPEEKRVVVRGIDEMGAPFSCFTQVTLMSGKTRVIVKREPFAVCREMLWNRLEFRLESKNLSLYFSHMDIIRNRAARFM